MGIGSSGVVNCVNTYLGTANYTVADGYVADRTVIVDGNGPAQLNLNFARNEVLDPRITFSRTSNATRTNAQGLIEYAPHNLLTYSEQFDNAVWSKSGGEAVGVNLITAPDGNTTADKLMVGSSVFAQTVQTQTTTVSNIHTASIYLRENEIRYVQIRLRNSVAQSNYIRTLIDLNTGALYLTGSSGNGSGAVASAVKVGNFWRLSLSGTVDTTGTLLSLVVILCKDTAGTVAGTANSLATDGAYLWGAQLNVGSLQPYYTTSVKNLLGYSQNFENAAWTKSNSTIDATPVMGPLGFLGAEKLVEDTATSPHSMQQIAITAETSIFTASLYCKAGEKQYVQLRVSDTSPTSGSRAYATFDLLNGTYNVGSITATNVTAGIIQLNSGWYRCTLTCGLVITGTTTLSNIYIANSATASSAPPTYTGDGTSGIYIFGAQLSDSASLDPYVYNFGTAPTSSAYYGPRFDYDPVTLAPKGLLIEEQRINILLNSDTLSTQSVSVTAQAYTLSFYGTGSVALSGAYTGSLVGTGVYPNRVQLTFTPAIGTLTLTVTGSVRYANLEAGSFPTSYIPTTSAQVTRTADNASMVGTNFSSWYNQSEGTVVVEFDHYYSGSGLFPRVVSIDDTTVNNRMTIGISGIAGYSFNDIVSGVQQAGLLAGTVANNINVKTSGAYKLNDFAMATNGNLGSFDTTASLPSVSQVSFGAGSFLNYLNGHLKSFKFFSKRFLNTYLQSLTQ